jgi:hypothetical protein
MTYPTAWFEAKVLARLTDTDQPDACWEWTGATNGAAGYGHLRTPSATLAYVHRLTFEQLVGPIPPGLVLDHLCRNPPCANPRHLEPVTQRANGLRGATFAAQHAATTQCPRGHQLAGDNLEPSHLANGGRKCRTCQRHHLATRRAAVTAARNALGLTQREYRHTYGESTHVAREITRRLNAGEALDGVRDTAPGRGHWGKRAITIQADPTRA